ncbi:DUF664 domain-containing protein [Deinococcus psychrotolerans]|uniref:DUF664 domain-containing protein n=1 Tax=Deinococcus psychrotolerans TaxID=2489213 RepID=A0A3G8Y7X4_9DEIO|nr:DUF664 domain-containing protein [Deinococcus psychrotolerans]AZI41479.1 DUF664 domain-containing protein [Deinococcus psychrotolerans]
MNILRGPPPDTLSAMLGHTEFASAEQITGHLQAKQAATHLPHMPHSIAEIVAHMTQNMEFNLKLIEGRDEKLPGEWLHFTEEELTEEVWNDLVSAFMSVLQQLCDYAEQPEVLEQLIYPATDTEPGWTVGYKLAVNIAVHNAYHLGQIVTLRQGLGAWPE